MESGIYVGNVEFDKRADIYAIDVAFRIDDEEGNALGVMKVVISLAEVESIIDQRSKDERLVNRFNFILFTADHRIIHTSMHDSPADDDGAPYFIGVEIPPGAVVVTAERTEQKTGEDLLSSLRDLTTLR